MPTRWPAPRPDEGRRPAATGGAANSAISCCLAFLAHSTEHAGITPQPMEDDGQLAGDRNRGLLAADLLDQPGAPGFERRPSRDAVQDDPGCLEQIGAHQRIAALGDAPAAVDLARLVAPRGQVEIGAN